MKRNGRVLSLLLAICLVATLMPTAVFAEVSMSDVVADDQIVKFAENDWIVIDNNASEMTLLLKTPVAPIAYNASGLSNTWDTSDAKAWCDNFAAENSIAYEVTFLTNDELTTYWANNAASNLKTATGWWLRHTDDLDVGGDLFGLAVSDAGFIGTPHVASNYGARPVIKIPAADIAMLENVNGEWNLVLLDSSAFSGLEISVEVDAAYTKATATYSGATSGKAYVVLTDRQGNVLKSTSADVNTASGSVELALPEDLMGWYTVRAFVVADNVASSPVRNEFAVEDSHGNVVEWNVNVGGDISANFNIELSEEVKVDANAKVTVTHNGTTKEILVSELAKGTTSDGKTECVKLPVNLHAPQMTDEISIQVVSEKGSGGEQTFTIREYAEAIINGNFNDETKDLVKHMLNYGAKAQTYFNYNTTDLANKNIGEIAQEDVPEVPAEGMSAVQSGSVDGIKFYGTSLVLNSETTLRFYYELVGNAKISDYTFTFNSKVLTVQRKANGGKMLYFVDVADIAPDQLNNDFTVTVSCNNGNLNVGYNPMWYIQKQYYSESNAMKFKNLLQAMYNYYLAAVAYAK